MRKLNLNEWLISKRKPKEIKNPLTTIYYDYSQFTLEEIDKYRYSIFECDGDSKKIKVIVGDVKE